MQTNIVDAPLGIFDSGIGGLTVANAIFEQLPQLSIRYVADTAHVPYGAQPLSRIQAYSVAVTQELLDMGCKLIVVACNTATAAALNHLRAIFPDVPFVGMEPAVKPAAQATRSGQVGVLATAGTFSSQRYADLMQRYAAHVKIWENPCHGLVPLIEAGQWIAPATESLLRSILEPMLERKVDTFVLGCTHYPLVLPLIRKIVGPDPIIIDPAPAVARQAARLLAEHALLPPATTQAEHRFFATGSTLSLRLVMEHLQWPNWEIEVLGGGYFV